MVPVHLMANEHILVIEDDPAVRTLLDKSLQAKGYRVTLATDGLDGLTVLERMRPDLILVDLMMPRLDGMTFVKAIKGHGDTQPIPIIILTAKNDARSMIDGINVGARFYVTKPFQIADLISKIEKALP